MALHTMSTPEDTMSLDDLSLLVELIQFLRDIDTNIEEGNAGLDNSEMNPQVIRETVLKPIEESHRAERSRFEPCSSSSANIIPYVEDPNSTLNRELISIFGEPLQMNVQATETPSWRSYAKNQTADKSRKTETASAYCEVHFRSDVRPTYNKKKNKKRKMMKN